MKATKIKMKLGCEHSNIIHEISQIYLEGCKEPGYYEVSVLYDYLKQKSRHNSSKYLYIS